MSLEKAYSEIKKSIGCDLNTQWAQNIFDNHTTAESDWNVYHISPFKKKQYFGIELIG